MLNNQKVSKPKFDLEERTTEFAKDVIRLCKDLSMNPINESLIRQIVRSSGSIGANYREANDALGKKDFTYRLKISRKETKETLHWLVLIEEANPSFQNRIQPIKKEAVELRNIFSSIISKTSS